jgi:glycosyltransferase involved in cell wall biosynthesis
MSFILKVLFDYQAFYDQNVGGISRVNFNLINELKFHNRIKVNLLTLFSFNSYLIENNKIEKYICANFKKTSIFLKIKGRFISRRLTNFILAYFPPKFFIPTYYDSYFLNSLGKTKMILFVHDLIHEIFFDQFPDSQKIISNKKKLIFASSVIITPSQCTKNDLLKYYPELSSTKVHVIYWASSITCKSNNRFTYKKQKIILFVGKRDGYKNFIWFINIISDWILLNNFVINCVGGGSFSEMEINLFKKLNIYNFISQFNITDHNLSLLYSKSFATIIPSLYEGFCLPIIESMSCRCPVIYADSSCMPEIAGFAGIKFKKNDKNSLLDNLNILFNDNIIYHKQIELGILRSSEFNWKKTSLKFKNILEEEDFKA